MKLDDIRWGEFAAKRVATEDGRIQLAPPDFAAGTVFGDAADAVPATLVALVSGSPTFV